MEFKLFFVALIIFNTAASHIHKNEDHTYSEEYYDSSEEQRVIINEEPTTNEEEEVITQNTTARYEVTELIDDIPNTEKAVGPVVTNFSLTVPLNHASNVTFVNNDKNQNLNVSKIDGVNLKKNRISIFHLNAEFDNENKQETPIQNIHIHRYPYINQFRDYIQGVGKGFRNGLQSLANRFRFGFSGREASPVVSDKFHGKEDFDDKSHKDSSIFDKNFELDFDDQ